jgi:hypothetical protein
VGDVVVSAADVAAKVKEGVDAVGALVAERRHLHLQWDSGEQAEARAWARRQEVRWNQLADCILHLENRVKDYKNCNHEEVKWYAMHLRQGLRQQFLEQVRVAAEPVVVVLPPSPPEDPHSIAWTNKPIILEGPNRAMVLGALAPVFAAERLGWGTLQLVLCVAQGESASVSSWSESLKSSVPWTLSVSALWEGAQIAEFHVASTHLDATMVHDSVKTVACVQNPSDMWPWALYDGTVATAFVEHIVFAPGAAAMSLKMVDRDKVRALKDKVDAHDVMTAKQKAIATQVDACSARACIRWLLLLDCIPVTALHKLQAEDYEGVLHVLRAAPCPSRDWKWEVPYATFAKRLLL